MTTRPDGPGAGDAPDAGPDQVGPPRVIVFDVNETLSDLAPMAQRFSRVGAPGHLAVTWFASVLRDGFALTATGANPAFAELAAESLRASVQDHVDDVDAAVEDILAGFAALPVHPDVVEGVRSLHSLDIRLVTLSNGSTAVAQGLFERNDIADCFERLLSVESAPLWKPAEAAYRFALDACGCQPHEAMLVAVHPWDIHGAHEAGLATAWVNRTGRPYPGYFATPDIEATSVVDLAAQLGGVAA
jgi:2-haloacid dehalogenase